MADESMMPSSANYSPEQALSYDSWISQNGGHPEVYRDTFWNHIGNAFSGYMTRKEQEYNTYLENLNKINEQRAIASARAYDAMREDTKYQRAVRDMKAAGLNPWLLVQGQGISGAAGQSITPSSAKGSEYSKREEKKDKTDGLLGTIIGIISQFIG